MGDYVVDMGKKIFSLDNEDVFLNGIITPTTVVNMTSTRHNETELEPGTGNETLPNGVAMSDSTLTWLTVLYTLTTVFSITGNVFVVLVFVRGRRSRTDLRPFLINLAAADLMMALFCMPFTFADVILGRWLFPEVLCPLVLFVQIFSVAASVFTNMAIGIDRFLAVTFPLRSRLTHARAKYVIIVIWISAFILGSVMFFVGRATEIPGYGNGTKKCSENWPGEDSRRTFTIFIFIVTYLVPLLILAITYSIVGILLWKRTAPGNKDHIRDMHRLRSKIKIVKMLVIVVAVFGICWLPIHVFVIIMDFYPSVFQNGDQMLTMAVFLCVHWLAMSNSFANPVIYGFTNESFRADLATLFYMWMPCCGCLKHAMPRLSSSCTNETVILRRQSTVINSKWNTNTNRLSATSKTRLQQFAQTTYDNKRFLEPVPSSRECSACSGGSTDE
ncbi:QRFP-like peptide receptor [Pecten maximus]|uniref:QRFP-like peptide receptor n=1 Tax=Pecten maximus TaxID=6579 RepID=UPI00145810B3|nr:QRFP-like peptide receptor [Pecten maximus]